jgi:hypothetical protein
MLTSATAEAGADSAAVMLNNTLRRDRNRDLVSAGWEPAFPEHHALHEDTMVEKPIMSSRNVVDLSRYRERTAGVRAPAISARMCRHCGAALNDGEREEECSSAFNSEAMRLRWQAAQILRGLI